MFYGITLYCVGRLHEESRFNEFASTYKTFGSLFLLGMAYIIVSEFLRFDKRLESRRRLS